MKNMNLKTKLEDKLGPDFFHPQNHSYQLVTSQFFGLLVLIYIIALVIKFSELALLPTTIAEI